MGAGLDLPLPNGHVQAVGLDADGRRQYRYHDAWTSRRAAGKWERNERFGAELPRARATWDALLGASDTSDRERVVALALRLLDRSMIRVGSTAYERERGTHGLTTLRRRHVELDPPLVQLDFPGKSGVRHRIALVDDELATIVAEHLAGRGTDAPVLGWRVGRSWRSLGAAELNRRVRELIGEEHSAKGFRTWHGTVLGAASLAFARRADREAPAAKLVPRAVKEVALLLGNTPAVARTSYIDPRVIDGFEDGSDIGPALAPVERLEEVDRALVRDVVEHAVRDLLAGRADSTMRRHADEIVAASA